MKQRRSKPTTYQRAHQLRREPTLAESILWAHLRSHRLRNVHFRQQHAVGRYIVDFCAPRQKLIVELDGSQHLDMEQHDKERTRYLASKGYIVLRFWNSDVLNHIDGVLLEIDQVIEGRMENK